MGQAQIRAPQPVAWLEAAKALARPRPATAAQPATRDGIDFHIATTQSDLASIERDWRALCQKSDGAEQMFLDFNWLWHWCAHYQRGANNGLRVLTGRRNGQLVVVWPMQVEERFGLRSVCFAGSPVSQYGGILVNRGDPDAGGIVLASWRHLLQVLAPDVVHLRKVRAGSVVAELMEGIGAHRTNAQAAPYIALAGEPGFEAFDERFSAKDRKNRRRKRKRLAELGRVGFRRSAGTQDALAAFRQAMRWKRAWLEDEARVSAALADRRFDEFFEAALTSRERPVGAEMFELTLDDKPVAVKLALTCGSHRGMHMTAYDRSLDKCSPGTLLVEEMIAAGLADGITMLDFLPPAFGYKLEWATGAVEVSDYCLSASSKGKIYDAVYVRGLRPRLQRMLTEGPAPLRRLAARLIKAAR